MNENHIYFNTPTYTQHLAHTRCSGNSNSSYVLIRALCTNVCVSDKTKEKFGNLCVCVCKCVHIHTYILNTYFCFFTGFYSYK